MTTHERNELLAANYGLILWGGRIASRLTGGRLSFDDAVSLLALRVVRRFDRWDPSRGNLGTFVGLVALQVAQHHVQYICRKCRAAERERPGYDFARIAAAVPADDFDADLAVYLGAKLEAALEALPPTQRTAVTLWYGLDGQGHREWSEIDPTVTRQAVEARLHAALRTLRGVLTGRRPLVRGTVVTAPMAPIAGAA